eukprot:GHVU01083905.1.p1 GENE.GHVU01083905.1~~GHVU01083905.1.p1  ORF type:complete len:121 (+),score=2.31 GHVU01083905.1:75-437(+)
MREWIGEGRGKTRACRHAIRGATGYGQWPNRSCPSDGPQGFRQVMSLGGLRLDANKCEMICCLRCMRRDGGAHARQHSHQRAPQCAVYCMWPKSAKGASAAALTSPPGQLIGELIAWLAN